MKVEDLLTMCWRLVLRNRRRYNAVLAGIALGTAGFIIVQTMGDSVENKMGQNLELLGEATVMMAGWSNHENYHPGQYYMQDVADLKQLPNVVAVAPVVSLHRVEALFKSTQWAAQLAGVDQSYWKTQSPSVLRGRLIGPSDVVGRKYVCVLGKDVVKNLFGDTDPVGELVRVGNISFEVIGILGGIQHTNLKRSVFIPITTAQSLFRGLYWIRQIYIRAKDWNTVDSVRENVLELLKKRHQGYEKGISVQYFPERIKRVKATVYIVKLFVYAAITVTVLLGGLGISNVMLAAVQDRTREIGLRKALGAKEGVILLQFLTEAVFISFFSGMIGVTVGVVSVYALKGPLGVEIDPVALLTSVGVGLIFTFMLGVVSGLYPSIRASRLDSVTAMRFE